MWLVGSTCSACGSERPYTRRSIYSLGGLDLVPRLRYKANIIYIGMWYRSNLVPRFSPAPVCGCLQMQWEAGCLGTRIVRMCTSGSLAFISLLYDKDWLLLFVCWN